MTFSNKQKAVLALIIANTIWGAGSPILKWSLQNIGPFTLAFFRFAIASLIIFPLIRSSFSIKTKDIKDLIISAFSGITINISFYLVALSLTTSINAPIIGSTAPIIILIASVFFLKERISVKKTAGFLMGFLGVMVIVLQPILQGTPDGNVLGNVFLIVATIASVFHILSLKRLSNKYDPMVLVFWSFVIGAITFIPLMIGEQSSHPITSLTLQGATGIFYGAVLSSFTAYLLQYWALKYLLASEIGLFTYLDPVIAIIIAAPLLGELPTPLFLIGSVLIFCGIYIAEGRLHYHPFHKLRL